MLSRQSMSSCLQESEQLRDALQAVPAAVQSMLMLLLVGHRWALHCAFSGCADCESILLGCG